MSDTAFRLIVEREIAAACAERDRQIAELRAEVKQLRADYAKLHGAVETYLHADPQVRGEAYRDLAGTMDHLAERDDALGWPACVRRLAAKNRELHDDLSFWEVLVQDDDTADWPHRDPRFRRRVEEKLGLAARLEAALRPFAERGAQLVGRDTDRYAVSLPIGEWRAAAAAMAGRLRPESVCEEAARAARGER